MDNLAELLIDRHRRSPDLRVGLADRPLRLADLLAAAAHLGHFLLESGVRPGDCVVLLGTNSNPWIVSWMSLQLIGAEAALTNPAYPEEMLRLMVGDLRPRAVICVGDQGALELSGLDVMRIDATELDEARVRIDGRPVDLTLSPAVDPAVLPGVHRLPTDVAGLMHTSGSTGRPKYCAQSHLYFLELGRLMADRMALGHTDTVFAPLPLFHINPLGYGIIPALIAGAGALTADRFSASGFWPTVVSAGATAIVLHTGPIEILKGSVDATHAAGHVVRVCFFADAEFLDRYNIPVGLAAYGSTEVGGVSHLRIWRRGDRVDHPEGMSRVGGAPRPGIETRLSERGELEVRAAQPHMIFEGYAGPDGIRSPLDAEGWFATGDAVRFDETGDLVFVERLSESIRVGGEYVPIPFVESHFAKELGGGTVALWSEPDALRGEAAVLYVAGSPLDVASLRAASARLPKFMRPRRVVLVGEIPRDPGVGKIKRRELGELAVLDEVLLTGTADKAAS